MVTFEHDHPKNHLVCKFYGHIDSGLSVELLAKVEQKLLEMRQEKPGSDLLDTRIEFDMKEVKFISSSFIRICLIVYQKTVPGKFSLTNCDPFLKKIFKIAGLDEMLAVL